MLQIQNALGILSSQVPTGNLLWVDQINGVDKLASRGRLTIPFRTLTAAKNAAASGDTIVVMPGTYDENNLLKAGVNWHFMNGAIVSYNGVSTDAIFKYTSGSATDMAITGHGRFAHNGGGGVINLGVTNAALHFYGISVKAVSVLGVITCAAGALSAKIEQDISTADGHAIAISGGTRHVIEADSVYSQDGGRAVYLTGGNTILKANSIAANEDNAIHSSGGSVTVDALEINAGGHYGFYSDASSALATLYNARILSAVQLDNTAVLRLISCVLLAGIDASGEMIVQFVGSCAKYDPGANVSPAGSLTVDANMS